MVREAHTYECLDNLAELMLLEAPSSLCHSSEIMVEFVVMLGDLFNTHICLSVLLDEEAQYS